MTEDGSEWDGGGVEMTDRGPNREPFEIVGGASRTYVVVDWSGEPAVFPGAIFPREMRPAP